MLKLNEFESVFESASKTLYRYEDVVIDQVLVVTDLDADAERAFVERLRNFLRGMFEAHPDVVLETVNRSEYKDVPGLFEVIERRKPDLICAYRNLGSSAWKYPYSLGEDLDVLTQATTTPVLVLPNPHAGREAEHALENTSAVMVVADHLTGDHRIVNWGVRFTEAKGALHLTHVESESMFDHYVSIIKRIPEIDTDLAESAIKEKLLGQPHDYIKSAKAALEAAEVPIEIEETVLMGHRLAEYRRLIEKHEVDLLVLNTKDELQQAMHTLAYPMAVEIRDIPLLML